MASTSSPRRPPPDPAALAERAAWLGACFLLAIAAVRMPCLAALAGFAILAWIGSGRVLSDSFGSARFADHGDLRTAGWFGPRGLILGRAGYERARVGRALVRLVAAPPRESRAACRYLRAALLFRCVPDRPLLRLAEFCHLLAVAPPGAGKGVGVVIPNLLTCPGSVVVIDPKGELFTATSRTRLRRRKNRIVRLDPLGVCGAGGSRLNPLDGIDPRSPLVGDQCAALAEALVARTGRESEDHWNDTAQLAISAAILYVAAYAAPADRNLNTVADLVTDPQAFAGMVAMMRDATGDLAAVHGRTPSYRLLARYGNSMASWQDRELSSVLSSVGRHLSWLHGPLIERHLAASDFDPGDLIREDVTVYLVLPPKSLGTLARLLRLWVTTLYGAITEGGPQEDRKVLFLLDEAGNIGPMPSLFQAITLGRGYGIRVFLILQALGQLKMLFPKDGEHQAVEASIDHRLFFGVRDYATAEALSQYLGTATVGLVSRTTGRGSSETGSPLGALLGATEKYSGSTNQSSSETESETSRRLLLPDEILQLPADAVVILAKGVPPVVARLARYYQAPEFAALLPEVNQPV